MNLNQVVQRAKSDIAKKYVYVMMPIPQLETLLSGLEDLQREIENQDVEIAKYHKLHDDGYNEMRIMQEKLEEQRRLIDRLRFALIASGYEEESA